MVVNGDSLNWMFLLLFRFDMKKVNDEIKSLAISFYRTLTWGAVNSQPYNELSYFEKNFRIILRKHLRIFTLWSIINCAGGLAALFVLKGSAYYFGMMCGAWGVINFFIAIVFFCHTLYLKPGRADDNERMSVQRHAQQMMRLNIGIDIAYMLAGYGMQKHSFISNVIYPDLWLGFGWAIIMQGFFLLVQDISFLCMYRRHFSNAKPSEDLFEM